MLRIIAKYDCTVLPHESFIAITSKFFVVAISHIIATPHPHVCDSH